MDSAFVPALIGVCTTSDDLIKEKAVLVVGILGEEGRRKWGGVVVMWY